MAEGELSAPSNPAGGAPGEKTPSPSMRLLHLPEPWPGFVPQGDSYRHRCCNATKSIVSTTREAPSSNEWGSPSSVG